VKQLGRLVSGGKVGRQEPAVGGADGGRRRLGNSGRLSKARMSVRDARHFTAKHAKGREGDPDSGWW
jgi:hypothetical protein